MEKQLVVFELASEFFGIEIATVESIVKLQEITRIPQSPSYMEGVTNLRGSVLPVIDLHKRFALGAQPVTNETRIVVVSMDALKVGMIVSAVDEVITIDDSLIEPPPSIGTSINADFITGIAKIDKRLIILLDLARVLSQEEKDLTAKMVSK